MTDRAEGGNREPRRPSTPGRRPSAPGQARPGDGQQKGPGRQNRRGGLKLSRLGGNDFEFVHPRCVHEMELDYAEGIELWEAGDPEAARDALRFALQGCGDNAWVHVALGKIALGDDHDPTLARGHFGYAYELAQRALPPGFSGRLPRHRLANRPYYEAMDGLIACYEALGRPREAAGLREQAVRLSGDRSGAARAPDSHRRAPSPDEPPETPESGPPVGEF